MGNEEEPKKESEQEFSFLQETIKPESISRDKVMKRIGQLALTGVIFGVFACLGFYALKPWVMTLFPDNTKAVTIPMDEETLEDEEQVEPETETVAAELTAQSYQELMQSMYEVAREANKSVVSVQRAESSEDWIADGNVTKSSVFGLIIADNGQELLILTDVSVVGDGDRWSVTFADNAMCSASLKKQDKNLGLAVISVPRTSVTSSTWNAIKTVTWGNSNIVTKGDVVIALGNTFGYADGLGYGVVSSVEHETAFPDGVYGVIATDIGKSEDGTGVLVNTDGEVVGIIRREIWGEQEKTLTNALAISDLKATIELLSNGESVPYIGIHGVTVSEALAEAQGIPAGLYVKQVDADSPAMAAGIQSGDVITKVGSEKITTYQLYRRTVREQKVGESVKVSGQRRGTGGYVDVDFTVTVGSLE